MQNRVVVIGILVEAFPTGDTSGFKTPGLNPWVGYTVLSTKVFVIGFKKHNTLIIPRAAGSFKSSKGNCIHS